MIRQEHQIDRFRLRLKSSRRSLAMQQQEQVSYLLHTSGFQEGLEMVLDRFTSKGEYLEIPALTVKFICKDTAVLPSLLLAALERSLSETIAGRLEPGLVQLSTSEFRRKVLEDFLLYGTVFYPGALPILNELVIAIRTLAATADTEIEVVIGELMRTSLVASRRIYGLLGEEGMRQLFLRLFGLNPTEPAPTGSVGMVLQLQSVVKDIPAGSPAFWAAAFRELQAAAPNRYFTRSEPVVKTPSIATNGRSRSAEDEGFSSYVSKSVHRISSSIPLQNAGLILIWTIFGRLFRACGYLKDRSFTDELSQQQAILLMQYLVTGNTKHEEYDLPLNKILCAWPVGAPLSPTVIPDPPALIAADKAFEDFIADWRGDRKYSADWFRAAFLQREGEITLRNDGNYELVVQRRTEDILLSPMTVIRLPWMSNLVFVQW